MTNRDSISQRLRYRLESALREAAAGSEALCKVIRDRVRSLLKSIRDAREARRDLAEGNGESRDDWERAFWPGDARLRDAFNDGAQAAVLT